MWSKGAVVIVKKGDAAIADAIEKGIGIKARPMDHYPLRRLTSEQWQDLIDEAERKYGQHFIWPKWVEVLQTIGFLLLYGITRLGEVTCNGVVWIWRRLHEMGKRKDM